MATNSLYQPKPSLLTSYRHELFKGVKHKFYAFVIFIPPALTLLIILLQFLIKIFGNVGSRVPTNSSITNSLYGLGDKGTFAEASSTLLVGIGGSYGILLIIAATLMVANEYRWNTIKMLATRQPVRANLVLSKCLFALTLSAAICLSFIVSWFIYALFLKYFYSQPFGFTDYDLSNIGNGLRYIIFAYLHNFILALIAIAMTYRFKTIVAGLIFYVIYNAIDGTLNVFGTAFANSGTAELPDWLKPLAEVLRFIQPYLLSGSINRIQMQETVLQFSFSSAGNQIGQNSQIVISNPVWLAWLMLAIYTFLFTLAAVWVFSSRDITD